MTSYRVDLRERDIDAFGHVHYAEYLAFLAQARNLWLAGAGIERPGEHVVARIELDYLNAARLADAAVLVEAAVEEVGHTSLTLGERVRAPDHRHLVRARTVVVRYDPAAAHPVSWTPAERARLEQSSAAVRPMSDQSP